MRRGVAGHPRQGGEGRQGERKWIARPGWLSDLPSPPEGGEEDEPEADGMTESPRRCPVAAGRWRGGRPSLSLSAGKSGRSGERLAMVLTVKTSDGTAERRGTGEEVGGILRPSSLSSCFVCSALPHHMKEENEDEAGRMVDRRGAALLLVDRRRCVAMWWR